MDAGFEEWVTARGTALLRAAFLLTGNQAAAEDLTQSTLEKVALAWLASMLLPMHTRVG